MGSVDIASLRKQYSGKTDEEIARILIESDDTYRFAISYTNNFAGGNEPTDIGFGFFIQERLMYMGLKNAKLLYEKGHDISNETSKTEAAAVVQHLQSKRTEREQVVDEIDRWIKLLEQASSEFDGSSEHAAKSRLIELGQPALDRLLEVALGDRFSSRFRKAIIFFLLDERKSQFAVQPLFDRYVKGKNPQYLFVNEPDGFGLMSEVKSGLRAMGYTM